MRRPPVLVLAFTLIASALGLVSSASAIAPGDTPQIGAIRSLTSPPVQGEPTRLAAYFPDGSFTVRFYKQTGPDTWESIGSDQTGSAGNAFLENYVFNGAETLYARITAGGTGRTDVVTFTPAPPPAVTPGKDVGNLSTSPPMYAEGDAISVLANFASGSFTVSLYKETTPDSNTWTKVASKASTSSGNATFSYQVNGTTRLFARKGNGDSTEVDTLTPTVIDPANFTQTGKFSINPTSIRDGRTATITANFPTDQAGRSVTVFQLKNGVWSSVGVGTANSSGDATISHKFDGTETLMPVTSTGQRTDVREIATIPPNVVTGGPGQLGKNVIYVTTDSGAMPVTKGVNYKGKAVVDAAGVLSPTLDVDEIAVRGNSTANKPKKPYKLKFEDKQKPFGMKSDKTWILLANYMDWTLVRSMVGWELGKMLDGLKWTPDSRFAELFLNGKYLGSYQIVQSIKIDSNRVNISKSTGQVIEFDPHWPKDGIPGMIGVTGVNYAWKDPDEFKTLDGGGQDPEGLTTAKISAMKTKIRNFEDVLYGKDWSKVNYGTLDPKDDWQTYLDLNSAVDYYLAKEYTKDTDADMYRSNFFYTNNVDPAAPDKFFMGPLWDFDRSSGARPAGDTTVSKPTDWWLRGNGSPAHDTNKIHWYTRITKDPRFLKALHDRWAAKKAAFDVVAPEGVTAAVKKLGGSDDYGLGLQVAANDRARWPGLDLRYTSKTSSYEGEIAWVTNWYEDRYTWMDGELGKEPPPIP